MFRTAVLRAARTLSVPRIAVAAPIIRAPIRAAVQFKPAFTVSAVRCYSAGGSLTKPEVEGRILDLLKGFDKVGHDAFLPHHSAGIER